MKASRLTIIELFLITTLIALLLAFGMHTHQCVDQYAFVLENASEISLSPDAGRVALAKGERWEIYDAETGRMISSASCYVRQMEFSPDGKRLVADEHGNTPQIWDVETGRHLGDWMLTASESIVHSTSGSYAQGGGLVFVLMDDDLPLHLLHAELMSDVEHAVSPDGRFLCVNNWEECVVFDTSSGKKHGAVPQDPAIVNVIAPLFLPRDNVVCLANDACILLWDLEKDKQVARIPLSGFIVLDTAVAPAGDQLAVCNEASVELWDLKSKTKATEFPLKNVRRDEYADMRFTPDGRHLRVVNRRYDPEFPGEYSSQVTTIDTVTGKRDVKTFAFSQRESFLPVGHLAGLCLWLIAWIAVAWRATRKDRRLTDVLGYAAVVVSVISFAGGGLLILPLLKNYTGSADGLIITTGVLLALLALVFAIVLIAMCLRQRPLLTSVSILILLVSVLMRGFHICILTGSSGFFVHNMYFQIS